MAWERARGTVFIMSQTEHMSNDVVLPPEAGMADRNNEISLRRTVTQRLRRYFAALTEQLSAETGEFWSRVEQRLSRRSADPGVLRTPMQQQPMQQQQVKMEPKDNEK
jgi:hypothetical protein